MMKDNLLNFVVCEVIVGTICVNVDGHLLQDCVVQS